MDIQKFKDEFVPRYIREITNYLGLSYLNCWEGHWRDGEGKVHSLDEMSPRYLRNCLGQLDRGIVFCNYGYVSQLRNRLVEIINEVDYHSEYSYIKRRRKKEVSIYIRDAVLELMEEKISDIEYELSSR